LEQDAKYRTERNKDLQLRDEKLVMIAPEILLDAIILASNSQYCVVQHSQTIEKDAEKILSCINRDGKILWQIIAPKFKTFEQMDGQSSGVIDGNTIAIVNDSWENKAVCGLDIQTGKLLWEFSAF
jgi:outer membrane protein assembly factor BamB